MSAEFFEEEEFQTKFNGKTFRRILSLAKPHWKMVAGFLGTILIVSGLDSFFTYLGKQIIDEGIIARNPDALIRILALYGGLIVIQAIGVFGFIYMVGILGERIRYDLRQNMFNHLQKLSLAYFSKTPVGWIMARVTSDTERVSELITWGILDSAWGAVNIITSMFFMFRINWKLALIVLGILPILFVIAIEFRKRIIKQYRKVRKQNSKIVGAYNENITGVRVVKALVRENENLREFGEITADMYRASYRATWLSALFLPSVQLVTAFAVGAIVWYGGYQSTIGGLSVGGIQAFISYITFMMWPIQDLARVFAEMQHAIASAERIFSLTDSVPDVLDRPNSYDPGTIRGKITFENVSFSYDDNQPVLENFSLEIQPGEMIALVGPTGGGKSTIVNLLCRFYEPREGHILIDGIDYTQFTLHSIQSRIGVVLQTPHLFSGSIRDNIRYGKLDASDLDVENAAHLAGAHEFIMHLDKGYDEPVGEGGNLLSTGQKQLISLARAILAQPEIFIMDEATSSVDTLTEAYLQKGMEALLEGRTSFVIAHRLSTIKNSDLILVMNEGDIIESGNHTELLARNGFYAELYNSQFEEAIA